MKIQEVFIVGKVRYIGRAWWMEIKFSVLLVNKFKNYTETHPSSPATMSPHGGEYSWLVERPLSPVSPWGCLWGFNYVSVVSPPQGLAIRSDIGSCSTVLLITQWKSLKTKEAGKLKEGMEPYSWKRQNENIKTKIYYKNTTIVMLHLTHETITVRCGLRIGLHHVLL